VPRPGRPTSLSLRPQSDSASNAIEATRLLACRKIATTTRSFAGRRSGVWRSSHTADGRECRVGAIPPRLQQVAVQVTVARHHQSQTILLHHRCRGAEYAASVLADTARDDDSLRRTETDEAPPDRTLSLQDPAACQSNQAGDRHATAKGADRPGSRSAVQTELLGTRTQLRCCCKPRCPFQVPSAFDAGRHTAIGIDTIRPRRRDAPGRPSE
jgi:hypothetical protein